MLNRKVGEPNEDITEILFCSSVWTVCTIVFVESLMNSCKKG